LVGPGSGVENTAATNGQSFAVASSALLILFFNGNLGSSI